MEVILLERIASLGTLGNFVKVKPGFARNYLIPQGKALPATSNNVKKFESQRAELEKASKKRFEDAQERAGLLDGTTVIIAAQSGEEGRLYGSIGTHDIVRGLAEKGHKISRSEIRLPDGPIRMIGNYDVELHLHSGEIIATIKVSVVEAV